MCNCMYELDSMFPQSGVYTYRFNLLVPMHPSSRQCMDTILSNLQFWQGVHLVYNSAHPKPQLICVILYFFVFAFARDVMWDCARGAGWCARRVPQIDHHQDPTADQAPNTKIHQTLRSKIDYQTPRFCTRHQQNTIILSAGYIVRLLIKIGIWFKQSMVAAQFFFFCILSIFLAKKKDERGV